jgi:drug/metabolite transporter (DMT)-like permease
MPDLIGPGLATVLLGLMSATAWGAADFGGGLLSRRAPLFGVVLVSLIVPCVLTAALSRVVGEPLPTDDDLVWATLAGLAAGVGILSLYHGLAVGRMSVVAPVTGVLAATIPVVVGIALEGTPSLPVTIGILLAILAVVLVSRVADEHAAGASGLLFGLLAGLGLGTFNVLADRLSPGAFLGQLAVFKAVEAVLVTVAIVLTRRGVRLPRRLLPAVAGVGMLDLVGNGAYILATQTGELAIAAVLSSLYPAVTIILATAVLRERVTRSHAAGMGLAAAAIVLIAGGATT